MISLFFIWKRFRGGDVVSKSKIETTKGLCMIALTKFLMNYYSEPQDQAYKRLMQMELFKLLNDSDTRLFLETNEYLCKCCKIEIEKGIDELYEFIAVKD